MTSPPREEEFRHYVMAERPTLVRTATMLAGGDVHLAEDLVQTVLMRLYTAWPSFRGARHPAAYARRALVNALLDEQRRVWRRREKVQPELPDRAAPWVAEDPRSDRVYEALRALPARMRAVVVLRCLEDLDVAETAHALDCSEGNVKSQLSRGLAKLREQLGDLLAPAGAQAPAASLALSPSSYDHGPSHIARSTW